MSVTEAVQLAGNIEKLGIIGILFVLCCLLGWAAWYFRKTTVAAHEQLTNCKLAFIIVKQAADTAGAKYDLSSIAGLNQLIGGNTT